MENCENLKEALQALEGKVFKINDKPGYRFEVNRVNYGMGKYYIYTQIQTFVHTDTQFKAFLDTITVLDDGVPVKTKFMSQRDEIIQKNNVMEQSPEVTTAITTVTQNAATVSSALMAQFNVLSGNPTAEDYRKAEAMSKMANTMTSVAQTQINLLNLKIKRS